MAETAPFTYQTRLVLSPEQGRALAGYAELYGRVERALFAQMQRGGTLPEWKRSFLQRFAITARQFNAVARGLRGKVEAIKERRPALIREAASRIRSLEKTVQKLARKPSHKHHVAPEEAAPCHGARAPYSPASGSGRRRCAPVLWQPQALSCPIRT
ncbi:MAG: hypothetical protein ACRETQ_02630 [Gammaproteobacteria bacterium]